jgi:hypothetical protein
MYSIEIYKVIHTCLLRALEIRDLIATTIREVFMLRVLALTIKICRTGDSLLQKLQFSKEEEATLKHSRMLILP